MEPINNDEYRVLITGSRDFNEPNRMRAILASLPPNTVIIHGGARGADSMADELAAALSFPIRKYPADWTRYGRRAGTLRNQKMLDEEKPHLVIAFPLPSSRGTWDMVRRAEKEKIEVRIEKQ